MDSVLAKVTQQAMNYALRSGIAITSGYAIDQCSRLLRKKSGRDRDELARLHARLRTKIRIVSPAIDMIELITARGNTSLESAVTLANSIRVDIQDLGIRLANAATEEELTRMGSSRAKPDAAQDADLKAIIASMQALLMQIEDAVPLINLAITTSGVNLSTNLPASISPSRLLQASTFLSAGDIKYASLVSPTAQIGPAFSLSVYMLFASHANRAQDEEGSRSTTWKEVMHKTRAKLMRVPLHCVSDREIHQRGDEFAAGTTEQAHTTSREIPAARKADEFAYHLLLVEDLNDDRFHTVEGDEQPGPFDDVENAGIREVIPIHEISKVFYADTGKVLNIGNDGEIHKPVLLIKRDVTAAPPRRMMDEDTAESLLHDEGRNVRSATTSMNSADKTKVWVHEKRIRSMSEEAHENLYVNKEWHLPQGLDPEWVALEVFTGEESDTESEPDHEEGTARSSQSIQSPSRDSTIASLLSHLHLNSSPTSNSLNELDGEQLTRHHDHFPQTLTNADVASVRTSLSLLEVLIRLASLQQFQQASHLTVTDELLNFFLLDSSTTGAASGDGDERQRIRRQARERVGFDPCEFSLLYIECSARGSSTRNNRATCTYAFNPDDESPIKPRGEQYQHRSLGRAPSKLVNELSSSPSIGNVTTGSPARSIGSPQLEVQQSSSSVRIGNGQSTPHTPSPTRFATEINISIPDGRDTLATPLSSVRSQEALVAPKSASRRGKQRSPLSKALSCSSEHDE